VSRAGGACGAIASDPFQHLQNIALALGLKAVFLATTLECRQQAERARNPLDKERWLKLAEQWLEMAQDADLAEI
jgi:hypothetical protein